MRRRTAPTLLAALAAAALPTLATALGPALAQPALAQPGLAQPASSQPASSQPGASEPPPSPAAASLQLAMVSPQVARPGKDLTLSGTLRVGSAPLSSVHLRIWVRRSITSRGQLENALHATVPQGSFVGDVALAPQADAGSSKPFRATVPAAVLAAGSDVAVRIVSLEARAVLDGHTQVVALRAVPVPWAPARDVARATRLTVVVPMASAPRRTAGDVFVDNGLATEVAPGGRLRQLLAAATGWTLAVDPSLVEDLAVLAAPAGYDVSSDGVTLVHHPANLDAAAVLTVLQARAAGGGLELLPYADVDLDLLTRAGAAAELSTAIRTGTAQAAALLHGRPALAPLLPESAADPVRSAEASVWLERAGTPIAVPNTQVPGTGLETYTPDAAVTLAWPGGLRTPGLVTDATLSAALAGDGGAAPALQEVLSQTAMHTAELPGRPRELLLVLPRDWNPSAPYVRALRAALASAPWLEPTSLASLAATALHDPESTAQPLEPRERPDAFPVSTTTARGHAAAGRAFAQILARPGRTRTVALAYERERLRLESGDSSQVRSLLAVSTALLQSREDAVHLVVNRRITLPASRSFPVTVRSSLPEPVRVAVAFSRSPRVQVRRTDVLAIPANSAARVEVATFPGANGTALLTAYLVSPEGAPVGQPQDLRLSIRGAGAPARVVILVAVAVFVLALGVRLVRRGRSGTGGTPPTSGSGPGRPASQSQEVPA